MSWATGGTRTQPRSTGGGARPRHPFIWAMLAVTLACQGELDDGTSGPEEEVAERALDPEGTPEPTAPPAEEGVEPAPQTLHPVQCQRTVTANVVALDQV
jgi:hypothetical protein